jgi:hypothetical protein
MTTERNPKPAIERDHPGRDNAAAVTDVRGMDQ